MAGSSHLYAIAIGSNRPHGRFGRPAGVVEAAIARLDEDFSLFDASPIVLNAAPEYEACAKAARVHQVPVKLVYSAALAAYDARR